MSEVLGEFRGAPILRIDEVDQTHYHIRDCPLCGEDHRHGSSEAQRNDLAALQLISRGAHCAGETGGEYWIVADSETEWKDL
jgi:hypothetical protein